jgi:hypothetical protein
MSPGLTVPSLSTDTDRSPAHPDGDNSPESASDIIGWSTRRGYHHLFDCSICDSLPLHIPETRALVTGYDVAIVQRDNHEVLLRDLARQNLQLEVERLWEVVHGLQDELAYYFVEDEIGDDWTDGNSVGGTNGVAHEVGDDPSVQ